MSLRRTWEVFRLDFRHHLRRPLLWFLVAILALCAWGLSSGHMRVSSGDADVGGTKSWFTSEFAMGRILSLLTALIFSFFVAVAAGMVVIRDDETKVSDLLHSTPLRASEYIWGKFAAVFMAFVAVLGLQIAFHAFANHALTTAKTAEFVGPFGLWNYLRPMIVFALPAIFFFAGTSFAVGAWSRRPILVFFIPVAVFVLSIFFLWSWTPNWLDPRINRLLEWIDPSGVRWLNETWLKVDRGVQFYNHSTIPLDSGFVASRIAFAALGLLAVWFSRVHLSATLRGSRVRSGAKAARIAEPATIAQTARPPLSSLAMKSGKPGFWRGTWEVARVERSELKASAGLYLFGPLILLQTVASAAFALGAFDTPLLNTSGQLAVASMGPLTTCVCLLLLFYTTESLERERVRLLGQIHASTPVRTASILFGKAIANSIVAFVLLAFAFVADAIVLVFQGGVPIEVRPFLVVSLLLLPTFVLWCSFVTAAHSVSRNRWATYGIGLAALFVTGYCNTRGWMNWAGNWPLWGTVQWSDMGTFELLRTELWVNRVMVLAMAVMFIALALRFHPRRDADASGVFARMAPKPLFVSTLRFAPWMLAPFILCVWLYRDAQAGFQGNDNKKKAKDYWAKNIQTWKDAPKPSITGVDLDLELEPARRWLRSDGTFTLTNDKDVALRQIPITRGVDWEKLEWTLDGEKVVPEDRAGLCIFTPKKPLAHGESLKLSFRFENEFPHGATKNGGGTSDFVLPSGVVLTSFAPEMVPMLGFADGAGVDEDNHSDAKVYPDDFYEGITDSGFGNNLPSTTHVRVTAPEEYTINSVGTLESDEVHDGKRTVVWVSDHPVQFFNVVAGRWAVRRGEGTVIYYHPDHTYNIDEMITALDGARRYYSEWFRAYPWKELKLSEFPNLASYAQGFPTNITFSENIGFLTKSEPKAEAAFLVTAHEAAHQWWGNILSPGKGPNGDLLSEGMSHFSTILLMNQMKGLHERIEFCKGIENRYGDNRQVDSEKPLVKIDGSRPGDTTCTYDKGGWVFWMLLNRIGRDQDLGGLRSFIAKYETNPDHPVLQDFIATMREFAPDKESFDDFVKQWFFSVVVPEYQLADASKTRVVEVGSNGNGDNEQWEVHVRVTNAGTGRMPVEIAAERGERFPDVAEKDKKESKKETRPADDTVLAAEHAPAPADAKKSEYRDARAAITLGAGESQDVVIRCPFEPERILVDPDALVLQLQRRLAIFRF
ncbi:MAG TPA: M1 family aminopeptidase [Planctomycetota bacterium]|nr:M1 family aminopeptidase [Planctomycetota bacterium]